MLISMSFMISQTARYGSMSQGSHSVNPVFFTESPPNNDPKLQIKNYTNNGFIYITRIALQLHVHIRNDLSYCIKLKY